LTPAIYSQDVQVRRFQLKFKNSHDYDTVYNYLRQLGLRISGSGEKQSRPSTSNTLSSATSSSSNLTTDRVVPAAGPSCPPSRLSEISHRPFTAVTAPTAVESQVQEAAHARPTSAYTGLPNKAPSAAMSFPGLLRPPEYFARPDSFTSSALESASASAATSSAYAPFDQPMATVEEHLDDRPETALLFNRPNTAEAPLPPRRELPFARSSIPRSSGSDTARPSSRPSTAMMGPPPLPARVASLRPPSSRSIALEAELPPLPKPTILSDNLHGCNSLLAHQIKTTFLLQALSRMPTTTKRTIHLQPRVLRPHPCRTRGLPLTYRHPPDP
jgi:hypothetical protein